MNTSRTIVAAVASATLVALGGLTATASAKDLSSSADVVRSTVHGHPYQNGGVSKEDAAEMDSHQARYNLRLTFSEGKKNDFAAGLKLNIFGAGGKDVFSLASAGPLTDVALPAGHYKVVADFGGVKRSGSIDVKPGAPAHLFLHWPKDET